MLGINNILGLLLFALHFKDVVMRSTFKRQSDKCQPVVMCPQFCLKIKSSCYVCDCGDSVTQYIAGAMQKMKHDYDPIYQTGSKFVDIKVGNNGAMTWPNSGGSAWNNNGMGTFMSSPFGGSQMGGGNLNTQTGQHYLEPDFKEFYRPVGYAVPGRCPTTDFSCPAQCWKTDVYSGCLRCDCGNTDPTKSTISTQATKQSTDKSNSKQSTSMTIPPSTKIPEVTTSHAFTTTTTAITKSPEISKDTTTMPNTHARKTTEESSPSSQSSTSQTKGPTETTTNEQETTISPTAQTTHNEQTHSSLPEQTTHFTLPEQTTQFASPEETTHSLTTEPTSSDLRPNSTSSPTKVQTVDQRDKNMNFTNPSAKAPSVPNGAALSELTGMALVKLLINGIQRHKSLQEVLLELTKPLSQGLTGVTSTTPSPVRKSQSKHEPTSTTVQTESTTISTGCVEIDPACPAECRVLDPLSECQVCACPRERGNLKSQKNSDCAPLDEKCPDTCITLNDNMCPVCSCSENISTTSKAPKSTTAMPRSSQNNFSPTTIVPLTSPSSQTICRVTEEVKQCRPTCLKFDEDFCPKCECGEHEDQIDIENKNKEMNICSAIRRDCPKSCIMFDERYCAHCVCDK